MQRSRYIKETYRLVESDENMVVVAPTSIKILHNSVSDNSTHSEKVADIPCKSDIMINGEYDLFMRRANKYQQIFLYHLNRDELYQETPDFISYDKLVDLLYDFTDKWNLSRDKSSETSSDIYHLPIVIVDEEVLMLYRRDYELDYIDTVNILQGISESPDFSLYIDKDSTIISNVSGEW